MEDCSDLFIIFREKCEYNVQIFDFNMTSIHLLQQGIQKENLEIKILSLMVAECERIIENVLPRAEAAHQLFQSRKESLITKCSDTSKMIQDMKEETNRLSSEMEPLRARNMEKDDVISRLKDSIKTAEKEAKMYRSKYDQLKVQIEAQLEGANQEFKRFQEQKVEEVNARTEEITKVREDLEELATLRVRWQAQRDLLAAKADEMCRNYTITLQRF
ncbi:Protein of unknown function [Gryllus bimaculatus]|nr:Protein of unknown function [Gryllus bimaculatus]